MVAGGCPVSGCLCLLGWWLLVLACACWASSERLPSKWLPVLAWLVVACVCLAGGCFSYEVARRLINLEELEYILETDEEPYEAACSRLVV